VTILSHWASPQYFSPNADGANDATTVSATLTLSANWTLTFKNGSGVTVRTFAGNGISVSQTWDGKNDSGLVVPVGAYTYTLEASEPASGVSAAPKSGTVRVDLSQPVAVISAPSQDATVFDTVNITGTASDDSGTIQHYDVEYGAGSSPPSWSRITRRISQVLNATLADWITNSFRDEIPVPSGNGLYTIRLTVQDWAGNVATDQVRVNLDNLYISNVSRTNPVIRPVQGETASINFTLNQPVSSATLRIVAEPSPLKQYPDQTPEADAIRTINLGSLTAGAQTAGWNGNDDASRIVPDEAYVYVIEARTASGRFDKFNQHVLPPVTTPSPAEVVFPANATAYDPYKNQFVSHSFQMFAGPARTSFKVEYTDSLNRTVTLWPQYRILLSQGLNTVFWDGRDGSGNIVNDVASMNYYISDFVAGCDPCGFAEHLNFTGIKGNYILVTGGTPVVPGVSLKSDPYLVYLSYGQIARLRYTLESDANVTVTVKEPASGALTTLLSDVAQTAGEHEVLWDGRNGSGQLSSTQGHYTFTVTATNPATGASRTRRANITVRK
jgi:flagellar hook assembly protein FlgD